MRWIERKGSSDGLLRRRLRVAIARKLLVIAGWLLLAIVPIAVGKGLHDLEGSWWTRSEAHREGGLGRGEGVEGVRGEWTRDRERGKGRGV